MRRSEVFSCSCGFRVPESFFVQKGSRPPYHDSIVFTEDVWITADKREDTRPLCIGGTCSYCNKTVCVTCSLFFVKRFCITCADELGVFEDIRKPSMK